MVEDDHNHDLSRRGRTEHKGTHQSLLLAEVKVRILLGASGAVVSHEEADLIHDFGSEVAGVDVEDLVKHPWEMVAESGELIGLWWCGTCVEHVEFFWEEPALVAEGEFELIAIALSLR